jgi:acyl-CoA thioesterase
MGPTACGAQTTVEAHPEGGSRYRAVVSDLWNAPVLPQGGIITALALRAMAAELGTPDEALRSVTTVFAAQVPPGPVDIDVTVLRRGRTMSQAVATVRPAGQASGHTAVAVFGGTRAGFEFTELRFPEVAPPEKCPSFRDPLPEDLPEDAIVFRRASFWERVESRVAIGHAPWDDWVPVNSERAYWYRFDDPPVDDQGEWDPLALVTLCDTMPGAIGERMGPGTPMWFGPSADLTVHVVGRATSQWLLAHNRAQHAGDGYASVEMELWDPERGLVACATQMMFFSFPDGVPPGARLTPPSPS